MSIFTSIRIKRRIAYAMLAVWMFASGAGWANACLLQDFGTHVHEPEESSIVVNQVPMVSSGHAGGDSDHEENSDTGKRACLKVCDDGTQTIVKSPSSFDLTGFALAPPTAIAWTAHLPVTAAREFFQKLLAPSQGPPLRTLYSRLVL